MSNNEVSALRVYDQDFLVTSTIDRCPKVMMVRELFKNALEAAEQASQGKVEFYVTPIGGVPKLSIWNNGPGMDDEELVRMSNIAASIGKEKGLDKNFGMGAKVASLPSNKQGLRYRSCKNGAVHEVILCQRDGVYGRMRRVDSNGNYLGEVVDVTDQVLAEKGIRALDEDWTEVVAIGNRVEQDTSSDPYDGDPPQKAFWLPTYLYHRFYRIPDHVEVRLHEGTHSRAAGTRRFETIPMRVDKGAFTRSETVHLPNGIKIHFIHDAPFRDTAHNASISGSIASAVSTCAVAFRDEMYSVLTGRAWTIEAPTFGIAFGAKHISVHIELPDDARVRPDGYRQFLRYIDGEQSQVKAADFALNVLENRPDWLVELIHSLAPNTGDSSDKIRERLQELLNRLRVHTISPRLESAGDLFSERGDDVGAGPGHLDGSGGSKKGSHKPTDLSIVPTGTQMARLTRNLERAPKLIPLDDDDEIEEKNIKGRAARYYPTGELFINMRYPAVDQMADQLKNEYAHASDPELMQEMALGLSRNSMIHRCGIAVVFALAKRLNKEWDEEAMGKALEPESLSLAADNYFDSLQDSRRSIGKSLNLKRGDAEQILVAAE
jgi:hypothetical protein